MFSSVAPVRVQRGSSRSTNGSDAELPALMPASHSHTHWPSPWAGPRLHGVEPDADDPMEDLSLGVPLQQAHPPTERVLGIVAVAMISFFNVSGGPIGSEQTIAVAGPAVGLTALGVMWLAFAVPQALVTAELSSAFPQNGGYSLWVETAFGRFWGIQESYWSWCSGVVDNALYPVLLYSTLTALFRDEWAMVDDGGADEQEDLPNLWACIGTSECSRAYLIKLLITILFTIPNIVSVSRRARRGARGAAASRAHALTRAPPLRRPRLARPRPGRRSTWWVRACRCCACSCSRPTSSSRPSPLRRRTPRAGRGRSARRTARSTGRRCSRCSTGT
jgi:hypothetical protein